MISFEKINFCAIVSRWISLKVARSKGSDNFWQGEHRLILFVYLYLVRINIKTEFCSIWSQNPRIFLYYTIYRERKRNSLNSDRVFFPNAASFSISIILTKQNKTLSIAFYQNPLIDLNLFLIQSLFLYPIACININYHNSRICVWEKRLRN